MKPVLGCDEIRRLLPHRYPFLMLDNVFQLLPGKEAMGTKNVTVNEPFFQGHFPDQSIMPGVMIVESLAQLTAIIYSSKILSEKGIDDFSLLSQIDLAEIARHVGYLVEVNVKFRKPVVPGEQLKLKAVLGKSFGLLTRVSVLAWVENTTVVEGILIVSQKES